MEHAQAKHSSMYGDVGDKIKVTTDRGNSYWCIIADIKGYDSVNGWYHVNSQGTINLIEFVVDSDYIPNECWQMGDKSKTCRKKC